MKNGKIKFSPSGANAAKGISDDSFQIDRYSDSLIEEKMKEQSGEKTPSESSENVEIMKPMSELIQTERDYIFDLRRLIEIYLNEYQCSGSMCPQSLRGKEKEFFGNIKDIYEFHSK